MKKKLTDEINNNINSLINRVKTEKSEYQEKNKHTIINRLYYESVAKENEKKLYIKKLIEQKDKSLLKDYTFSPTINKKSNELYKRKHAKIEDKLYYDYRKKQEKKNYDRIMIINTKNRKSERGPVMLKSSSNLKKNVYLSRKSSRVIESDDDTFNSPIDTEYPKRDELRSTLKMGTTKTKISLIRKNSYTEQFKTLNLLLGSSQIAPRSSNDVNHNFMRNTICYNSHLNSRPKGPSVEDKLRIDLKSNNLPVKVKTENPKSKRRYSHSVTQRVYINKNQLEEINKKKNEIAERELKLHCSFNPKINKKSVSLMKHRKESKKEMYDRLTKSKKAKSLTELITIPKTFRVENNKWLNKSKTLRLTEEINTNKSREFVRQKSLPLFTNESKKRYKTLNTDNVLNTTSSEKRRIREMKFEERLTTEIDSIRQNDAIKNKIVENNFEDNIRKFKTKKLTEFYQIVEINCPNLKSLDKLNDLDIPVHIRDKIIIPTCKIIKNRKIDFNFENFYHISEEILNTFFIYQ
jgi:hypothetical protein